MKTKQNRKIYLCLLLVIFFSLIMTSNVFAATVSGCETVHDDVVWMGWTYYESGNVTYNQAGGDGGAAYGRFQFDYRYCLVEFLKKCVDQYPDKFSMLKKWTVYSPGDAFLKSSNGLGDDWKAAYNADPGLFSALQDEFAYDYYYVPAKKDILSHGIDLDAIGDPIVKGTVYSIAIRDGVGHKNESCTLSAVWQTYEEGITIKDWLSAIYDKEAEKHPSQKDRWAVSQKNSALNSGVIDGTTGVRGGLNAIKNLAKRALSGIRKWMDSFLGYINKLFHFTQYNWYDVDSGYSPESREESAQALMSELEEIFEEAHQKNIEAIIRRANSIGWDENMTLNTYLTNGNPLLNMDIPYILSVYSIYEPKETKTLSKFRDTFKGLEPQLTHLTYTPTSTQKIIPVPVYKMTYVQVKCCYDTEENYPYDDNKDGKPEDHWYTEHHTYYSWYYKHVLDSNGDYVIDFYINDEEGKYVPDYEQASVNVSNYGGGCSVDNTTYFTKGENILVKPDFETVNFAIVTAEPFTNDELWTMLEIDKNQKYYLRYNMMSAKEMNFGNSDEWSEYYQSLNYTHDIDDDPYNDSNYSNEQVAQLKYNFFAQLYGDPISKTLLAKKAPGLTADEISEYLDALPEGISGNRKQVIKTALTLVNQVPYCNAGQDSKPKKPGYDETWMDYNRMDGMGRPSGLDSSGFVMWAFWTAGFSRSEVANLETVSQISNKIPNIRYAEDIQPGDIGIVQLGVTDSTNEVYNHVGIYLGDGKWILNSAEANTVSIIETEEFDVIKVFSDRMEDDDLWTNEIIFHGVGSAATGGDLYSICQVIAEMAGSPTIRNGSAIAEALKNRAVDNIAYPNVNTVWDAIVSGGFEAYTSGDYKSQKPTEAFLDAVSDVFEGKSVLLNNPHVYNFALLDDHAEGYGKSDYPYSGLSIFSSYDGVVFYIHTQHLTFSGNSSFTMGGRTLSPVEIQNYVNATGTISAKRKEVVKFALECVGLIPYYFGGKSYVKGNIAASNFGTQVQPDYKGRSKKGLDCSGYVTFVFDSCGISNLEGGTDGQWKATDPISEEQLLPGDLAFKNIPDPDVTNHVAIYIGGNKWVHCNGSACNVSISQGSPGLYYYRRVSGMDE